MKTRMLPGSRGVIGPVVVVALATVAVLGNANPLAAQSRLQDQEVTVLTLQDALRRAAEHNPEYRQALNRLELEGPQRRQALGAFLPDFSVSYGTGQNMQRELSWVDFDGTPITNPEPRTVTTFVLRARVLQSGNRPLPWWEAFPRTRPGQGPGPRGSSRFGARPEPYPGGGTAAVPVRPASETAPGCRRGSPHRPRARL